MRFTLGKMFLAIAMLALACAGMMYHTSIWERIVFGVTIAMYSIVLMSAVGSRSRYVVSAVAFSMVGGIYLLLVMFSQWRVSLITNDPLTYIARALELPETVYAGPDGGVYPSPRELLSNMGAWPGSSPLHHFFVIGHCVFSWIFAVLAAWFAGRMYDRRERTTKEAK